MTQTSDSAIAAALAVAREQGIRSDDPVVLRDAWHILLHLRPAPVVARVSTGLAYPEGPDPLDLVRELAVASHAARAGAPVIPPAEDVDPGPHERGGHIVTFWRYIPPHPDPDPAEAGRALRVIHEALTDCEVELAPMTRPRDMEAMFALLPPGDDVEILRDAASFVGDVDRQALHGDAHLWNCLGSSTGPLWHDFETACRGPREYDLAALVMDDRAQGDHPEAEDALRAYGEHDESLLEAMLPVYASWVTTSMLVALPRRPEVRPFVDARLEWLKQRAGAVGGVGTS
jgi:Phosphotransferase enzyme family